MLTCIINLITYNNALIQKQLTQIDYEPIITGHVKKLQHSKLFNFL